VWIKGELKFLQIELGIQVRGAILRALYIS